MRLFLLILRGPFVLKLKCSLNISASAAVEPMEIEASAEAPAAAETPNEVSPVKVGLHINILTRHRLNGL